MRSNIVIGIALWALAGHGHAQPSNVSALPEQLFEEGRHLAEANRWSDACPKFEQSLRYKDGLGTRLNLATCYEHLDRFASAYDLYRRAIDVMKPDDARRQFAEERIAILEPRVGSLTIALSVDMLGIIVMFDGNMVQPRELGISQYVDAGEHRVTASAPGLLRFTTTVMVVAQSAEIVSIPKLLPVEVATQGNVTTAASGQSLRSGGVALIVAGSIAVGLGAALDGPASAYSPPDIFVLWGAGAAAITGGVVLYLVGRHRINAPALTLGPAPLRDGAVAMVSGRW